MTSSLQIGPRLKPIILQGWIKVGPRTEVGGKFPQMVCSMSIPWLDLAKDVNKCIKDEVR